MTRVPVFYYTWHNQFIDQLKVNYTNDFLFIIVYIFFVSGRIKTERGLFIYCYNVKHTILGYCY